MPIIVERDGPYVCNATCDECDEWFIPEDPPYLYVERDECDEWPSADEQIDEWAGAHVCQPSLPFEAATS
jgi:hypothetical protein